MTETEKQLLDRVNAYLSSPVDPTALPYDNDKLKEAGDILMQYAPGRYRMLVRRVVSAPVIWSIKQLNDSMLMLQRQLANYGSVQAVRNALPEIMTKGHAAVEKVNEIVKKSSAANAGKRPDHDKLSDVDKALYEENLSLLQKQRSLFERMKVYAGQLRDQHMSGAAPCDIEETSHMLQETAREVVEINDRRLDNWRKYDTAEVVETKASEVKHNVDGDTLRKLFNTNQSYISRYGSRLDEASADGARKVEYAQLKANLQKRVDELLAAGWQWPENGKWKSVLAKHGLKV